MFFQITYRQYGGSVPLTFLVNSFEERFYLRQPVSLNANKAGLFEGSFFGGGGGVNLTAPSYFQKNLSNITITLYNC